MSGWIDVIDEKALADGENMVIDVDGTDVAVFKIDGGFYAIEGKIMYGPRVGPTGLV